MNKDLVINALNQAIGRYNPTKGIIHHSDQGTQYTSYEYSETAFNL
ncbi:DDE-type integrase/transposase/recombinase [Lutispora thermophila]|uniref:Putative transposase n=1 Tax=Lutispora thermophila DSM 19022 TaxID=1122184 RepID=A0A1M6DT24_9FIRM|nr:putative transposase [Lutispora thermophila DSM 19022]